MLTETTLNVASLDAPIKDEDGKKLSMADVVKYEDPAFNRLLNEMDLDFFLSKLQPHEEFVLSRSYGIPREMTNIEIAEVIGCHRNEVTGIRNRALRKGQRIATHLKSQNTLTGCEDWAVIMADPIEDPQIVLFFG